MHINTYVHAVLGLLSRYTSVDVYIEYVVGVPRKVVFVVKLLYYRVLIMVVMKGREGIPSGVGWLLPSLMLVYASQPQDETIEKCFYQHCMLTNTNKYCSLMLSVSLSLMSTGKRTDQD